MQFAYNEEDLQIASATYENKCATLEGEAKAGTKLGLVDCAADDTAQQFVYDDGAGYFHPQGNESLCLAVGDGSRSAGPFMSRDLALASCEETDTKFMHWTILADK